MSIPYSNNRTHDGTLYAAELARQNAVAAATTQAALRTADINYHRAALASCLAQGIGPGVNMQALKELGVT